jgi:circadian clock protein KaiB
MSQSNETTESPIPSLMLFVAGNAPRSHRARENLTTALEALGLESIHPMEIDLLQNPEQTVTFSVFATPALIQSDAEGGMRVLYGDLSEKQKLHDFLRGLR